MTMPGFESPFQIVLAHKDRLSLTPEQRRTLELLDIEFQSEAIRLCSERQLLELDARRNKTTSPSGSGFTVTSLAAVDGVTAKLRQHWLLGQEQARTVLSTEQLAKLPEGDGKLPGFDSDLPAAASPTLEAQVAEIIAARMIESKLASAKHSADESLARATNLKAQVASAEKQLGEIPTLAKNVESLSNKVERLEQIRFEKSSALLPELQATLDQEIKDFRTYLVSLGYHPPKTDLKIFVDADLTDNMYYDGEKIVVGAKIVSETDGIYREYTERALNETKPGIWDSVNWKATGLFLWNCGLFPMQLPRQPKIRLEICRNTRRQVTG